MSAIKTIGIDLEVNLLSMSLVMITLVNNVIDTNSLDQSYFNLSRFMSQY